MNSIRCSQCEHYIEANAGEDKIYGCDRSRCVFEPTTKNDLGVDCISRADAIQTMQDKAKKLTNEDTINGLCGAVAILYEMPSVTPQEPKTGHWIDCKCDKCGYEVQPWNTTNFCPNCGSDNREVEE